jgi:hypothetical protein
MTQSSVLSLIRTLLTLAGAYLFGKNFFGLPLDEVLWQEIVGIGLGVIAIIWSVFDKTITGEVWQGVVRHVITFASGILVAKGIVDAATIQVIIAALAGIFPWLQSTIQRSINKGVSEGGIKSSSLSK